MVTTSKIREINALKPPKFPTVTGLRHFRLELYERTALCGQDKKHDKSVKWLQCMEGDKVKEKDLRNPGRKYESLDRKLAIALQSILPKELEMKVNNAKA